MKNIIISNLKVDETIPGYGILESECDWGRFSVVLLNGSISLMKDTMISNTFAGVAVYGGTFVVENTNFVEVGSRGSVKYPSVERHIRCGM
jgi:hypothetical protein